jgi:protein ImuA
MRGFEEFQATEFHERDVAPGQFDLQRPAVMRGPEQDGLMFQPEMDARLPGGGLALGALHEVAGAGNGALDGAAVALFATGIMARTKGQILWCVRDQDLFAPGLEAAGLSADRVMYVEAGDEQTALSYFEEGLRHGGLAGVVAEVGRLSMTNSRRL